MLDILLPYMLIADAIYGFIDGYNKSRRQPPEEKRGRRNKTYWSYRDPRTGIGFGFWD